MGERRAYIRKHIYLSFADTFPSKLCYLFSIQSRLSFKSSVFEIRTQPPPSLHSPLLLSSLLSLNSQGTLLSLKSTLGAEN